MTHSEYIEELTVILVEFALAARPLISEGKFFDKNGKPQEGTVKLDEAKDRICSLNSKALPKEKKEELHGGYEFSLTGREFNKALEEVRNIIGENNG